jgi:protocatechuate 3,4-dioxygenase beta subunit
MSHDSPFLNRRQLVVTGGALGLAALLPRRLRAAMSALPSLPSSFQGGCVLSPAQTEGPFYFNAALQRADITEGLPGFPLVLNLRVLRVAGCAPIPNAIVDVWHTDADGLYAGYATGQVNNVNTAGQNFLRGIQLTDQNGWATFHTIYPGWYPGRTVHIHVKVILGNQTAVTSQLYFPDTVTDEVYAAVEPYTARGTRTTRNAQDGIYSPAMLMALTSAPGGMTATFTIGIA